jgi:1,4-alpha-glucan branching enzyme
MFFQPGKKLLFMGGEFGQWGEWAHDQSLDWHLLSDPRHAGLAECVRALARLYRDSGALHEIDFHWSGFEWIDFADADHSVIAFLRRGKDPRDCLVVAGNFTPVPRSEYRIAVPEPGYYRELFNSDAAAFGGSNLGNLGGVQADAGVEGRPFSIRITLPPLAVVVVGPESARG